jgi:hypothetical protein
MDCGFTQAEVFKKEMKVGNNGIRTLAYQMCLVKE